MINCLLHSIAASGLLAFVASGFAQDHGHLNVGAVGTSQDENLIFDNGAVFATDFGYIKTLTYTNGGRYAGYYQGNITLTALPATAAFGGPAPNAPALGSQIYAQIVSVDGPADGTFSFWDSTGSTPEITLLTGTTNTNLYKLSQGDGSPGLDPYGHIHGRRFTASKPGIYTVTFRALDLSTNGIGGGPIHTPSDAIKVYFQAGINIASIVRTNSTNVITFGSVLNSTFYLEANDDLGTTEWLPLGSVLGNDLLQSLSDATAPANGKRFYRIRVTAP